LAADGATLANCDREPIHSPGSIQPHGALVAFDPGSGSVLQASTNLRQWLAVGDLPTRGRAMADLFGADAFAAIEQALRSQPGLQHATRSSTCRRGRRSSSLTTWRSWSTRTAASASPNWSRPAHRTSSGTGCSCSATPSTPCAALLTWMNWSRAPRSA
jgi:hypothetical protein